MYVTKDLLNTLRHPKTSTIQQSIDKIHLPILIEPSHFELPSTKALPLLSSPATPIQSTPSNLHHSHETLGLPQVSLATDLKIH